MSRYFFHLRYGDKTRPDADGVELPNLQAAEEEAIATAREMLAEAIRFQKAVLPDAIIVTDRAEKELRCVALADALPASMKPPRLQD
jgi:hypothetical protein